MYAIFYKEWIKTRWYFLLAVLATLGFTSYCMLRINRVVEMKGAAHVWEVMLQRDVIFIDMLQYIIENVKNMSIRFQCFSSMGIILFV